MANDEKKMAEQDGARFFEEHVFARFDTLDTRLSTLGVKADRRLHDTRPILEDIKAELVGINTKLDEIIAD